MFYYKHVDVFSHVPFSGNSLSVFFPKEMLTKTQMQKIAEEMRHFESIFVYPISDKSNEYRARIFTMEEELDFAGHPLIGAASSIHDHYFQDKSTIIKFKLNTRDLEIHSTRLATYYSAVMDQGVPKFVSEVPAKLVDGFLSAFNLAKENLADFPFEVISTGLNYLIIPLKSGLDKVQHGNISELLLQVNAKFVYFYDILKQEGRTWNNDGKSEDIATGSAVGPLGAYLVKHKITNLNETIIINQGSFLSRPSKLKVVVHGANNSKITKIEVSGDVCLVGSGCITANI